MPEDGNRIVSYLVGHYRESPPTLIHPVVALLSSSFAENPISRVHHGPEWRNGNEDPASFSPLRSMIL